MGGLVLQVQTVQEQQECTCFIRVFLELPEGPFDEKKKHTAYIT